MDDILKKTMNAVKDYSHEESMFFAPEEIEILMDALRAWEVKDGVATIMLDLVGHMAKEESEELRKRRQEMEFAASNRREQSILLQGKLLRLKKGGSQ